MTAPHLTGEIINQRYQIEVPLGAGGMGTTYRAIDLQTQQRVALKALSLRRLQNWKALELFEREARVLAQLQHPAIPQYLDHFQVDTERDRGFYLVQQFAPGQSLLEWVEQGWRPTESEVSQIARQILAVLVYLQEFTPAVIHRDIKPQNVIRREDGQLFLVDFGAVQDVYRHTVGGGSTIVGTFGYMAPEQFRGQANLTTDLYGLGTTLLFLLTGDSPAQLPQRQLKIDFRKTVKLSRPFARWLEGLIEPAWEARPTSAQQALVMLREKSFSRKPTWASEQNLVHIEETSEALSIIILPGGFPHPRSLLLVMLFILGNGVLVGMLLLFWGNNLIFANFGVSILACLCLAVYGCTLGEIFQRLVLDRISLVTLHLRPQGFTYERRIGPWRRYLSRQMTEGVRYRYHLSAQSSIWGRRLVFTAYLSKPGTGVHVQSHNAKPMHYDPFTQDWGHHRDRFSFGSLLSTNAQNRLVERIKIYSAATPISPLVRPSGLQNASPDNLLQQEARMPSVAEQSVAQHSLPNSFLGKVVFVISWTVGGILFGGLILISILMLTLILLGIFL